MVTRIHCEVWYFNKQKLEFSHGWEWRDIIPTKWEWSQIIERRKAIWKLCQSKCWKVPVKSIQCHLSCKTRRLNCHTNSDVWYLNDWHIPSGSFEMEFPEKSNVLFLEKVDWKESVVIVVFVMFQTNVLVLEKTFDSDDGIDVSSLFLRSLSFNHS